MGRRLVSTYWAAQDVRRQLAHERAGLVPLHPACDAVSGPDRTLLYWPAGGDNPYFRLLYGRLPSGRWSVVGMAPEALFDAQVATGFDRPVVHIHWTQWITHGLTGSPRARLERALATIDTAIAAGGGLIVSIHEPLPHEHVDRDLEIEVKRELVARASLVHFLHNSTFSAASALYPLASSNVHVIPMPLFSSAYAGIVDNRAARQNLGLPEDRLIVAMVGNLKPWKGIDRLLDAHDRLRRSGIAVETIVAGQPIDVSPGLRASLDRARSTPGCRTFFGSVPDSDFVQIVAAADVVAVPYDVMHNSAVVYTAISFGTVALAPDTQVTRDAAQSGLVELYDGANPTGFSDALVELAGQRRRRRQIDAHFAASHDAVVVSDAFTDLLDSTFR